MSETSKKYYLTTPIYYVNARPHIGHAYTTIVADVLARRHRLLGEDVFFLTGTDEHGQKIERSAAAAGIPPQQFTDQVAAEFQKLWDRMGITYSKFIRTTDPAHKQGAQKLFAELYARGYIYLSTYTGAYCVSDEAFVDVPVGTPCPDCGRLTEQVTEENFFFKLSEFQAPLINLIETGVLAVEPESRRNEVLSFLRGNVSAATTSSPHTGIQPEAKYGNDAVDTSHASPSGLDNGSSAASTSSETWALSPGPSLAYSDLGSPYVPGALKDLSISRSSFTWGIPVPEHAASAAAQKHVIYVWLDALTNYMTALGYGATGPDAEAAQRQFQHYWPADLQLVGKEIIRFHCVYWPAFLLAAELPLPKAITAHGWLLFDNSKMSKSRGNIVRTETILQAFGTLCPAVHKSVTAADSAHQQTSSFRPEAAGRSGETPVSREASAEDTSKSTEGAGGFSPLNTRPQSEGALAPEGTIGPPTAHERDLFASDVLRYFLLREIPFGQDGSFSFDALITRYNADLANGYGNLVSRTLTMIGKYSDNRVPQLDHIYKDQIGWDRTAVLGSIGFGEQNLRRIEELAARAEYDPTNAFSNALTDIWNLVKWSDDILTLAKPWKDRETAELTSLIRAEALYVAAECIRLLTALLYPILPYATARVWAQLGLRDIELAAANGELKNLQWGGLIPGTKLGPLAPIFPRADKGLAQIMIDLENTSNAHRPTPNDPRPETPLKQAFTPTPAAPIATDPTHPAAPPTALDSLAEASGTLPVAGSTAISTGPDTTPSHAQAPASGPFASAASQMPITSGPADASPQITIDDFAKVELRVAEIKVCERIPKADKLLRLEVDLGHETRQILSGIAEFYTPEELIGRRIIVITNLAPRKMRGLDSHGMLLAASGPQEGDKPGKPILATVPEGVSIGSRLK